MPAQSKRFTFKFVIISTICQMTLLSTTSAATTKRNAANDTSIIHSKINSLLVQQRQIEDSIEHQKRMLSSSKQQILADINDAHKRMTTDFITAKEILDSQQKSIDRSLLVATCIIPIFSIMATILPIAMLIYSRKKLSIAKGIICEYNTLKDNIKEMSQTTTKELESITKNTTRLKIEKIKAIDLFKGIDKHAISAAHYIANTPAAADIHSFAKAITLYSEKRWGDAAHEWDKIQEDSEFKSVANIGAARCNEELLSNSNNFSESNNIFSKIVAHYISIPQSALAPDIMNYRLGLATMTLFKRAPSELKEELLARCHSYFSSAHEIHPQNHEYAFNLAHVFFIMANRDTTQKTEKLSFYFSQAIQYLNKISHIEEHIPSLRLGWHCYQKIKESIASDPNLLNRLEETGITLSSINTRLKSYLEALNNIDSTPLSTDNYKQLYT